MKQAFIKSHYTRCPIAFSFASLSLQVTSWGIRRMKTLWGACNPRRGSVWLNLELIKKPPECLEYLVVHELVHLIERHHDDHFHALMDAVLPSWRNTRRTLNAAPLADEVWDH